MKKKVIILVILSLFSGISINCKKDQNHVLNYLKNSEIQYEGKLQKENIIRALQDTLTLSQEQLKLRRYKDYTGKENQ